MASPNPEDRSLISQLAALERWGRTGDRTAATAPARAGLRKKFANEIDPDGKLPVDELESRVDQLLKAHMLRMTLAAKTARRKARELTEQADVAEHELSEAGGLDGAA